MKAEKEIVGITLPLKACGDQQIVWNAIKTRRQAMDEVIDWLNYYNHKRLHSTRNYISSMKFEQNCLMAQLEKIA